MEKFFVSMIVLAHVVASVHCFRPITEMLPLPPLPSPSSSNNNSSPIGPPPSPYDHDDNNSSISAPPTSYPYNVPSISPSPSPSDYGVPSMSPSPSPSDYGVPSISPSPSPSDSGVPSISPSPLPSDDSVPSISPSASSNEDGDRTNHSPPPPRPIINRTLHNVLDYGAKGNGRDDDSRAFKDAWDDACQSHSSSGIYVPGGRTYKLMPVTLSGPCNSDVTVQIDGELVAPEEPSEWGCSRCYIWIVFDRVDGLTIQGSGSLDGRGSAWWRKSFCEEANDIIDCHRKPTALDIGKSNNVLLRDLTFKDSPQMHIVIKHSTYVHVTNLTVLAPGNSPNTDGIHIQNSEHVYVSDCDIGTGDDCISISSDTSDIYVRRIRCGPGHGISIGSLGKDGAEDHVENIHVKDVRFRGSTNGVRIKTWQGGKGYARNIVFEDIICDHVRNPIIIDQFYCIREHCSTQPSAVQISNVTYSNIWGTSYTKKAIELECSAAQPCTDIILKDINLHWARRRGYALSSCSNVHGLRNGNISPHVPCLEFDSRLGYTH